VFVQVAKSGCSRLRGDCGKSWRERLRLQQFCRLDGRQVADSKRLCTTSRARRLSRIPQRLLIALSWPPRRPPRGWTSKLLWALVHDTAELEAPINAQGRETPGALVVLPDVFASIRRELTIKLATRDRLPAIYPFRFFATSGGLMSYGVDPEEPFGKVSEYADRILRGERPGHLRPNPYPIFSLDQTKAL
jgi:hypothetical protein